MCVSSDHLIFALIPIRKLGRLRFRHLGPTQMVEYLLHNKAIKYE